MLAIRVLKLGQGGCEPVLPGRVCHVCHKEQDAVRHAVQRPVLQQREEGEGGWMQLPVGVLVARFDCDVWRVA